MKLILRITFLIVSAQFLGLLFLFVFNDFSFDLKQYTDELSLSIIDKKGVDLYVFISQLFTVLIPALLFLVIFHYKNFSSWIKIKIPGNLSFFVYGLMLLFLAYPLIQFSAVINQKLPISQWLIEENKIAGEITNMIINFSTPYDLIVRVLIVALLPAIGEELFFRAGLQNELLKGIRNPDIAIILAAILFSAFHMQFEGFLPRFFLGLIMGYLYHWSSSILVPVLIHFMNNLMLLISAYFMQDAVNQADLKQIPEIPLYILLLSAISVFIIRQKLINLKEESIIKNNTT